MRRQRSPHSATSAPRHPRLRSSRACRCFPRGECWLCEELALERRCPSFVPSRRGPGAQRSSIAVDAAWHHAELAALEELPPRSCHELSGRRTHGRPRRQGRAPGPSRPSSPSAPSFASVRRSACTCGLSDQVLPRACDALGRLRGRSCGPIGRVMTRGQGRDWLAPAATWPGKIWARAFVARSGIGLRAIGSPIRLSRERVRGMRVLELPRSLRGRRAALRLRADRPRDRAGRGAGHVREREQALPRPTSDAAPARVGATCASDGLRRARLVLAVAAAPGADRRPRRGHRFWRCCTPGGSRSP